MTQDTVPAGLELTSDEFKFRVPEGAEPHNVAFEYPHIPEGTEDVVGAIQTAYEGSNVSADELVRQMFNLAQRRAAASNFSRKDFNPSSEKDISAAQAAARTTLYNAGGRGGTRGNVVAGQNKGQAQDMGLALRDAQAANDGKPLSAGQIREIMEKFGLES